MANKKLAEKLEFVLFSISSGIALWMLTVAYQFFLNSKISILSNPLFKIAVFLLPIYLVGKLYQKICWDPFGKYSKAINFLIMMATAVILFITIKMF